MLSGKLPRYSLLFLMTLGMLLGSFPLAAQRTFPAPQYYVEQNPYEIASGDFNNDGHPDLFVSNQSSANISVLLNNGDGTFAEPYNIGVGNAPIGLATADMNNDNNLDIVCQNNGSQTISVIL